MPVLHLDLSAHCAPASPELVCTIESSSLHLLLLDISTYKYTTETCAALGRVYTLGPVLRDLSWTWTCLDNSSMQVLLLDITETCAALGHVYKVHTGVLNKQSSLCFNLSTVLNKQRLLHFLLSNFCNKQRWLRFDLNMFLNKQSLIRFDLLE
jgi:hypothetical protein